MAVIVSDTFNRANNASLGSAETGQAWQIIEGGFKLNANKAEATNGAQNTIVIDSGVSDGTVSADLYSGGNGVMLIFRLTDLSNYLKVEISSSGSAGLYKVVGGSSSALGSTTLTYVSGAKVEAVLSGNSIIIKYNGVQVWSVTDTFNQTATKHGIGSWFTGTSQDNFLVDGAGTPAGTPGSISYATKQVINRIASTAYATKQAINQTTSVAFATKQIISSVGSSAFATKQTISQVGSIAYATQQTITDGGIPGSVAYSTKQIISLTASLLAATRQSIYQVGSSEWATKQNIMVFVEIVNIINLSGTFILTIELRSKQVLDVYLQGSQVLDVYLRGGMR